MALFKALRGSGSRIEDTPFHDGYVYLCPDNGNLYFDALDGDEEKRIKFEPGERAKKSLAVYTNMPADAWVDGEQTIVISGMTSEKNGMISVSENATTAQMKSAEDARIIVKSQSTDSLTIKSNGVVPLIDIPIVIILIG